MYIQEISSGVHTINGVSTSIAAFFGRTAKGPLNKAIRCLSMSDFNRAFGGPHPKSDLAQSVQQFFDNGGTDCYVVRLADDRARAARITLTNFDNDNVLIATAKTPGLWGNGLRLEVDYNTSKPDETFNLVVIQMDAGKEIARESHLSSLSMDPESPRFAPDYVTRNSALIDLKLHEDVSPAGPGSPAGKKDLSKPANSFAGFSQSRPFKTKKTEMKPFRAEFENILTNTPILEISVDEEQYVKIDLSSLLVDEAPAGDGAFVIVRKTDWDLENMANCLQKFINARLNDVVTGLSVICQWVSVDNRNKEVFNTSNSNSNPNALRITADSGLKRSVRIVRADDKDFAVPMMMGIDQGGIEVTSHSNFRPVPTGAFFLFKKLTSLASLPREQITRIKIDSDPEITFKFEALPTSSTDLWFEQKGGGTDGVREKLQVIAQAVNENSSSKWKAEVWGYHLAFYSKDKDASVNLVPSAVMTNSNALSGTVADSNFSLNVRQYVLGMTGTSAYQKRTIDDQGADGDAPKLKEFRGDETEQTGFHALDSVDLFNLMVIPGDTEIPDSVHTTLWGPASIYCGQRRAFLLMDAPPTWTSNSRPEVITDTSKKTKELRFGIDKKNSAVFYPRLIYVNGAGVKKSIGAAGALAGLMARTDSERGVWKAPAGIEADIRGIVGLEVNLTDTQNGVLNKLAVNCIRTFPNGFVNWGARTNFGSDDDQSEWKYIPIRRLALFIEESLYRGTKWVVFEPNDEPLWAQIRLNIGSFMNSLFRQGAFQGKTPQEAYFVKCDKDTTTQNDRNLGIVNIIVGFAPLKPAEFVVISIQQMAGELQT